MLDELKRLAGERDRHAARCPLDKQFVSDADRKQCSACGAFPNENCQIKASADHTMVMGVRSIIAALEAKETK